MLSSFVNKHKMRMHHIIHKYNKHTLIETFFDDITDALDKSGEQSAHKIKILSSVIHNNMKHLEVSTFIAVLQRTPMMQTDPIAGRNVQLWEQN